MTGFAVAEIPSNEVLEALRQRLLVPPQCQPECASISRLLLEAHPTGLRMRLEVLAAAQTAIPLPGDTQEWPEHVSIDGNPAPGLLRGTDAHLWLQVGPGIHQVLMYTKLLFQTLTSGLRPMRLVISIRLCIIACAVCKILVAVFRLRTFRLDLLTAW